MHKLVPVEEARALMREGREWGVWRWLAEKRRVRAAADRATEAFDEAEKKVKASWSDGLNRAYTELALAAAVDGSAQSKRRYEKARREAEDVGDGIKAAARRVREADDAAYRARVEAEEMFDDAEARLSAGMAREAAQKALDAYDLRERAIRKAEAAARYGAK